MTPPAPPAVPPLGTPAPAPAQRAAAAVESSLEKEGGAADMTAGKAETNGSTDDSKSIGKGFKVTRWTWVRESATPVVPPLAEGGGATL